MYNNEGQWQIKRSSITKTNNSENIVKQTLVYLTKDQNNNYIIPRIFIETIKLYPTNNKLILECEELLNQINRHSPIYISNIYGIGENNSIELAMLPILKEKLIELKNINYHDQIINLNSKPKTNIIKKTKK